MKDFSLILILLLAACRASAYQIGFYNDGNGSASYPAWSGGGTATWTDDQGQAQTQNINAKWDYGPDGSVQWYIYIFCTNGPTVNITWNPPGYGDTTVQIPKDPTRNNLYTIIPAHYNVAGSPPTCTNQTITLANNSPGTTCSLVWTLNGSKVNQVDNVCYGQSQSFSECVYPGDSFTGGTANVQSSMTNIVVTLSNPSGSGQIQNFKWFVNGQLAKEIDHVCPGTSQGYTVTVDTCNGNYNTQQANVGPSSTNMNMTVSNPSSSQTMSAYWMVNGQILLGMTLPPGGSYTYSQTFDLCGNPNLNVQWGGIYNGADGNSPGNTPWDGLTNIFGNWTNLAPNNFGGQTRSGGGTGDSGSSTGTGSTGATGGTGGTGTSSSPDQPFLTNSAAGIVWTNNIAWPTPPKGDSSGTNGGDNTSGLALDSTLRAGFGQLHQDNGQILQGMGVLDKDLNNDLSRLTNGGMYGVGSNVWVMNQISLSNLESQAAAENTNLYAIGTNIFAMAAQTTVETNELGQLVTLTWAVSNDVLQVVKAITNSPNYGGNTNENYLGGIFTNAILQTQNEQTYDGIFTNDLGQLVQYEAVLSNEMWFITKYLTNPPVNTNPIAFNSSSNVWVENWPTNPLYPTNIWVANMPTNFGSATNPPLTNYATESTLEGISNLLASLLTNGTSSNDINGQVAQGVAAAVTGSNTYSGIFSSVDSTPAYAVNTGYGNNAATWEISIPYGRGYTIDLNPFHQTWVSDLASFVRNLVKWIFIGSLLLLNIRDVLGAQKSLGATRQATAAGETILGTNANSAIALLCAVAITLAMLALPAFAAGWFTGYIGTFARNPFNGVGGTVGTSVWMVDQFFPLGAMVACVFCRAIFTASLSAVVWTVQTVVRFICG